MNKNALIGIIVALIVVVGGGFALMSGDDDSSNDSNENTSQQQEQTTDDNTNETEATSNVVELAVATDSLSTLVTAVTTAELAETLSGEGPFTVFAPNNDAFAALDQGVLESLLLPENKEQLQGILTYHVVPAKAMSGDLTDGQVLTTVQGNTITVGIDDESGTVTLVDATGAVATVIQADIAASNGVVHVIDSVVLPE